MAGEGLFLPSVEASQNGKEGRRGERAGQGRAEFPQARKIHSLSILAQNRGPQEPELSEQSRIIPGLGMWLGGRALA